MTGTQLKNHLVTFVESTADFLAKDLNAVEEEDSNTCPGGCARPPLHFIAECAGVNGMIADLLTSGEMHRRSQEEREAHLRSFDTREKALGYLNEQTARLVTAIQAFDENRLGETTDKLFGRPTTWFAVGEFPAIHMMYHDGQINYLHTLNGDSKIHWW